MKNSCDTIRNHHGHLAAHVDRLKQAVIDAERALDGVKDKRITAQQTVNKKEKELNTLSVKYKNQTQELGQATRAKHQSASKVSDSKERRDVQRAKTQHASREKEQIKYKKSELKNKTSVKQQRAIEQKKAELAKAKEKKLKLKKVFDAKQNKAKEIKEGRAADRRCRQQNKAWIRHFLDKKDYSSAIDTARRGLANEYLWGDLEINKRGNVPFFVRRQQINLTKAHNLLNRLLDKTKDNNVDLSFDDSDGYDDSYTGLDASETVAFEELEESVDVLQNELYEVEHEQIEPETNEELRELEHAYEEFDAKFDEETQALEVSEQEIQEAENNFEQMEQNVSSAQDELAKIEHEVDTQTRIQEEMINNLEKDEQQELEMEDHLEQLQQELDDAALELEEEGNDDSSSNDLEDFDDGPYDIRDSDDRSYTEEDLDAIAQAEIDAEALANANGEMNDSFSKQFEVGYQSKNSIGEIFNTGADVQSAFDDAFSDKFDIGNNSGISYTEEDLDAIAQAEIDAEALANANGEMNDSFSKQFEVGCKRENSIGEVFNTGADVQSAFDDAFSDKFDIGKNSSTSYTEDELDAIAQAEIDAEMKQYKSGTVKSSDDVSTTNAASSSEGSYGNNRNNFWSNNHDSGSYDDHVPHNSKDVGNKSNLEKDFGNGFGGLEDELNAWNDAGEGMGGLEDELNAYGGGDNDQDPDNERDDNDIDDTSDINENNQEPDLINRLVDGVKNLGLLNDDAAERIQDINNLGQTAINNAEDAIDLITDDTDINEFFPSL